MYLEGGDNSGAYLQYYRVGCLIMGHGLGLAMTSAYYSLKYIQCKYST